MNNNEFAKNWGLVIFVLGATAVLYLFLIFTDRQHHKVQSLQADLEELINENARLNEEVIYLQNQKK